MASELKDCRYGKSNVRLLKVIREGKLHDLHDVNVEIQVFGAFERAYRQGDNGTVLPTDSMKNTVYALARQYSLKEIEKFALELASHFLKRNRHVTGVKISISEKLWQRVECSGGPHGHAFRRSTPEQRLAVIDKTVDQTSIRAAVCGLEVLKSAQSAFEGFLCDEYTTLKETRERILATRITADWLYGDERQDYTAVWQGVRAALLETFAGHDSRSVQHTLYAMGDAVLRRFPGIREIHLSMPNLHCLLVDLSPFHLDNPNQIFLPVEEPIGVIEATLISCGQEVLVKSNEEACIYG